MVRRILIYLFTYLLVVPWFEIRALHLLGRYSATWATSSAFFCVFEIGSCDYLPGKASNVGSLDLCFLSNYNYWCESTAPGWLSTSWSWGTDCTQGCMEQCVLVLTVSIFAQAEVGGKQSDGGESFEGGLVWGTRSGKWNIRWSYFLDDDLTEYGNLVSR
jgi:hypothetical protein